MRAKGRHPHNDTMYIDEVFTEIGWNMYMEPEKAAQGVLIFDQMNKKNQDNGGHQTYHDITRHPIFQKKYD